MISQGKWWAASVGFLKNEAGGEVVEIALVIGLIAVVCLIGATMAGAKVALRWGGIDNSQ